MPHTHASFEQVTETMLEKEIMKYRKHHHGATDSEVISHVAKYKVPSSVVGSPQWHANCLADLIAMVKKWGMPHYFLTLTAGDREVNGSQWQEVSVQYCDATGDSFQVLSFISALCLSSAVQRSGQFSEQVLQQLHMA